MIVGERTNANGSRQFREAMLAEDWESCLEVARSQVAESAHLVDLCVDYVGRDGVADMQELAGRFATQVAAPLVLDSTEPEVMQAGLELIGGRSVLNSANLEDGDGKGSRLDRVLRLARELRALRCEPDLAPGRRTSLLPSLRSSAPRPGAVPRVPRGCPGGGGRRHSAT